MQELEHKRDQQVHEQIERLRNLESLINENQIRTENKKDQMQEAIRHTQLMFRHILGETPRERQREVETGHADDQQMNGKHKKHK